MHGERDVRIELGVVVVEVRDEALHDRAVDGRGARHVTTSSAGASHGPTAGCMCDSGWVCAGMYVSSTIHFTIRRVGSIPSCGTSWRKWVA